MSAMGVGRSVADVRSQAGPYPLELLKGCETGLVLFAAAFLGANDAIHFSDAGLETTCVDSDAERLQAMSELYPPSWTFVSEDAWSFAERNRAAGRTKDAVSVDTFTGSALERSLASLDLWCSLACKLVTVTITAGAMYRVPEGWRAWHMRRSGTASWLVLERA